MIVRRVEFDVPFFGGRVEVFFAVSGDEQHAHVLNSRFLIVKLFWFALQVVFGVLQQTIDLDRPRCKRNSRTVSVPDFKRCFRSCWLDVYVLKLHPVLDDLIDSLLDGTSIVVVFSHLKNLTQQFRSLRILMPCHANTNQRLKRVSLFTVVAGDHFLENCHVVELVRQFDS